MAETTALACPEHKRCVVKLVTVIRETGDSRPIVAPKWAEDWMQSQQDRWLTSISHTEAEQLPEGLLTGEVIVVPRTLPGMVEALTRRLDEMDAKLEDASRFLHRRVDSLERETQRETNNLDAELRLAIDKAEAHLSNTDADLLDRVVYAIDHLKLRRHWFQFWRVKP